MKKINILLIIAISTLLLGFSFTAKSKPTSDAPKGIKYQGVINDSEHNPINGIVWFRVSIVQKTVDGTIVYQEEHPAISVEKGLFNLDIGFGFSNENFGSIDWSTGKYFLKVETKLNSNGDYNHLGTSLILSVPFALYAQNSGDSHWEKEVNNDLIYSDGKVVIENDSLSHLFEVKGVSKVSSLELGDNWPSLKFLSEKPMYWEMPPTGSLYLFDPTNNKYRMYYDTNGNVGIGTSTPTVTLDVNGALHSGNHVIKSEFPALSFQNNIGNTKYFEMTPSGKLYLFNPVTNSYSLTSDEAGRIGINTSNPESTLDVNGMLSSSCITIRGGCDIVEDFNSIDDLQPGDVVVIDEKNPKDVRRTNQKYDRKVAGVISGANGVNSGISLSQKDVVEGEYPLAMLGRVYVKVTGKVEIGDMLTTSNVPGHAMAVNDFSNAFGTVIGKAMTANEGGEGMVWLLVQPH